MLTAFAIVLGVLTAIVWLTSSLRQLDLVVSQGQTFFLFLYVTALALPLLIGLIAPFCLFIATLFVLNKLNTDSELIVMSASGLSQLRLVRPLIFVGLAVSLVTYVLNLFITPISLRTVRETVINGRADFISQAIQPGRFTTVDQGLTFHVRDRAANGVLLGVFVNDNRDPQVNTAYLGARGVITRTPSGNFLVLQDGEVVRRPKSGSATGSVIAFESYAFSLSSATPNAINLNFPPQERSTEELIELNYKGSDDLRVLGRARSELHDRFATPLYSLAFALIAFAALGRAKTTRESRSEGVIMAIVYVTALRILGFFATSLVSRNAWAIPLTYLTPLLAIALAGKIGLGHRPIFTTALLARIPSVALMPFLRVKP